MAAAGNSSGGGAAEAFLLQSPTYGSLESIREQSKAKAAQRLGEARSAKSLAGNLPALLMPCFFFVLNVSFTALFDDTTLGLIALGACLALSVGFLALSRSRPWQLLGFLCLIAVVLGHGLGSYSRKQYLVVDMIYRNSVSYDNVLPNSDPLAFKDAGSLTFSRGTLVDSSRSVGYMDGDLWCAAPVVSGAYQNYAGFWAVGTNCCRQRGYFACGDVLNASVLGGLMILRESPVNEQYKKAALMAAVTYGVAIPDSPSFIQWDVWPNEYADSLFQSALKLVLDSCLAFVLVVPLAWFALSLFGLSLFNQSTMPQRRAEMTELLTFGFDFTPREYPRSFVKDLLHGRLYWSGEVLYDYAFHISNKHLYLGCLFAHPAHPYSKRERFIVGIIVCSLIVFPVSAYSETFGETGLVRTIVIMVGATIPRNVLKLYLIQITQLEEEFELEGGHSDMFKAEGALQWEVIVLGGFFVLAICVACLCTVYIKSHSGNSVIWVLARNSDGLCFSFLLELLFDLVIPYFPPDRDLTLGFFGRWRMERDDYEEAEQYLPQGKFPEAPARATGLPAGPRRPCSR